MASTDLVAYNACFQAVIEMVRVNACFVVTVWFLVIANYLFPVIISCSALLLDSVVIEMGEIMVFRGVLVSVQLFLMVVLIAMTRHL